MNELSLQDVLNATYKLNDWLNFYWNFYVVFSGVVVGWAFNSKGWTFLQRAVVTVCYLGFVVINFNTLYKTYYFLNIASSRIDSLLPNNDILGNALVAQLGNPGCVIQLSLHVIADIMVILCIWKFGR